ncbi:MAG: ABC transporter ATP-binding protein [Clostridia bacterium]|nr:ABC transporter ATP-binding protein [Clostridia bacterium]
MQVRPILREVKEYKRDTFLTPLFAGLEVVMEVLIPYVTAMIIDRGIDAGNMQNGVKYGLAMLGMAAQALVFGVGAGWFGASASTGFARNLRKAMYEKVQTFSFSNIDKFSTAGLITRMTTDVTNVQNAYQMVRRIAGRAPLNLVFSVIMIMFSRKEIALVFFSVLAVVGGAVAIVGIKTMKLFREVFRRYDDLNASAQENISAIRVVKAFVREDYEDEKYMKAATNVYNLFVKAEKRMVLLMPGMMLAIYIVMVAIAWMSAHFIVAGTMTTGNLTSLFSYIMTTLISLIMLAVIFVMLTMSSASADRISEVLTEEPDIQNPENPLMEVPDGSIRFENVHFTYIKDGEGDENLHDIDLEIKSGETVGIIGGTGCGKSTLVSLISRLYDPDETPEGAETPYGGVYVGGHNVREYDLDTLRDKVAVVLQKNELFSGTILDNLRWGKEDATLEECVRVCQIACADEFIQEFPDGYETRIEQGGTNVSGGQKQRLCIARALLKEPQILILDDSTSAVDTATEARIRKSFREDIPATTKIIISQRIASVQEADRIIVMDDGGIDGFDTHENLLENNAIYREIYDTQMNGSGDFDAPG